MLFHSLFDIKTISANFILDIETLDNSHPQKEKMTIIVCILIEIIKIGNQFRNIIV